MAPNTEPTDEELALKDVVRRAIFGRTNTQARRSDKSR